MVNSIGLKILFHLLDMSPIGYSYNHTWGQHFQSKICSNNEDTENIFKDFWSLVLKNCKIKKNIYIVYMYCIKHY